MAAANPRIIERIIGRAIPVRGHDIDTDRIIPARFLKSVSFEHLEAHVFEDDRRQLDERGGLHPFSNPVYRGATVLMVGRNFGCGSSREHAPQALVRWGIRAVLGESFSEIFFGNAVALGMPCLRLDAQDVETLLAAVEADPGRTLTVDVAAQTVALDGTTYRATLPAGARQAFTTGSWDGTALLLDRFEEVRQVAARLPYMRGFGATNSDERSVMSDE